MLSNLELDIASIINIVIIAATILTIVYCRTHCNSQTRQARLQQLTSSSKITAFALQIVAPVASTAIVAVIGREKQIISEILYTGTAGSGWALTPQPQVCAGLTPRL